MAFLTKPQHNEKKILSFTKGEIEFLMSKLSDMDFKGREVELLYNVLLKLQEYYKNVK